MRRCGICSLFVVTVKSSPCRMHENFRQDILVVVRQKGAAGPRFQPGDAFERLLHFIQFGPSAAGDFRNAPFAERFHVILDDAVFESVLLPGAFQLAHEAFLQIARAHTGRIETSG